MYTVHTAHAHVFCSVTNKLVAVPRQNNIHIIMLAWCATTTCTCMCIWANQRQPHCCIHSRALFTYCILVKILEYIQRLGISIHHTALFMYCILVKTVYIAEVIGLVRSGHKKSKSLLDPPTHTILWKTIIYTCIYMVGSYMYDSCRIINIWTPLLVPSLVIYMYMLASFYLPSHLSFKHVSPLLRIYTCIHVYITIVTHISPFLHIYHVFHTTCLNIVILSISGVQSHLYTCTCAVLLSRLLSLYHHCAYNTTFCSRTYTCTYMVILITSNVTCIHVHCDKFQLPTSKSPH